jgi:hypothetical protein
VRHKRATDKPTPPSLNTATPRAGTRCRLSIPAPIMDPRNGTGKPCALNRHGSALTIRTEWGLYNAAKAASNRNRSPRSGGFDFHRQDPLCRCALPGTPLGAHGFPEDPTGVHYGGLSREARRQGSINILGKKTDWRYLMVRGCHV